MEEIWKKAIYIDKNNNLIDFREWYEVSNLGRVRSYRDHGGSTKRDTRRLTPIMLKASLCKKTGYCRIALKLGDKRGTYLLHRLVASTFLEIPHNLKDEKFLDVNHIDEDKQNNNLDNLHWCSRLFNNLHGTRLKRAIENGKETRNTEEWRKQHSGGNIHNARAVIGVHVKTGETIEFESMAGVSQYFDNKLADRSVSATIRGKQKTAYGYKWYYKEDYEKQFK